MTKRIPVWARVSGVVAAALAGVVVVSITLGAAVGGTGPGGHGPASGGEEHSAPPTMPGDDEPARAPDGHILPSDAPAHTGNDHMPPMDGH